MRKRHEMRELEGGSTKQEEEESTKQRNSIHSVPFFVGCIFVILICGLYGLAFLIEDSLPSPLHIGDEVKLAIKSYSAFFMFFVFSTVTKTVL